MGVTPFNALQSKLPVAGGLVPPVVELEAVVPGADVREAKVILEVAAVALEVAAAEVTGAEVALEVAAAEVTGAEVARAAVVAAVVAAVTGAEVGRYRGFTE
jgi:hypothetical protein